MGIELNFQLYLTVQNWTVVPNILRKEEFGEIRAVTIDGEPWFVGKDVASILGYANQNEAIQDHIDKEDKLNSKTLSSFNLDLGQRGGWLINESGLYSLILSSKLESAKKFKHWVTSEVLPSIRKHGMYATEDLLNNPDLAIKAFTALKEEREKNRLLQEDIDEVPIQDSIGRMQNTPVINESGLYSLILSSKKPNADSIDVEVREILLSGLKCFRTQGHLSLSGVVFVLYNEYHSPQVASTDHQNVVR